MRYQVIISDRARQMLGMHIRFLAQVNKPAAVKLKIRFLEELRSLQEMPQRYPFFNENYIPANKYHKLYVENWFLVLYQIKDDTVYVDWVVDCRQDYQWLIK
ncbi:MAG: type II toxin-antitoxin system RelE/ParE family toxin [Oscillospiraceae bacterium]|nr:type II toxin-antitoxin system RelE/ParE family toxin [Oscillospiraceae bacterium]MBQ5712085.1 type II toxin-antitoxin system RelE/ParE family toxin [Oscillospiraceae bacterium]